MTPAAPVICGAGLCSHFCRNIFREIRPIVSDYMPGGGGRKAANHIYRVAKPDAYVLAPGTPKPQVQILQEAFRKALSDPDFHREFKKLSGFERRP